MDKEFRGIFPYLVSPIDKDGSVMEKPLRQLVNYLIDSGVHGLTPLGSTGEFYYLNWEQKRRITEIVLDEANGRVPVTPGISDANTLDAVKHSQEFEKMGADGILLTLTRYFPLSSDAIENYFRTVSCSVSVPIVLYNNPKFSNVTITTDILDKLQDVPNIQYYKDATGNTGNLLSIINRFGDRYKIFSASAHIPVSVMMLGGVGWMAGPACIIPKESVALYNLCVEKKWDEAIEYQKKMWAVNQMFAKYNLAACIKACLEIQGIPVGEPISPNRKLSEEEKKEIREAMSKLKI